MHDVRTVVSTYNIVMCVYYVHTIWCYIMHTERRAPTTCVKKKNRINNKQFLNRRGLLSEPYDRHRPKHRA